MCVFHKENNSFFHWCIKNAYFSTKIIQELAFLWTPTTSSIEGENLLLLLPLTVRETVFSPTTSEKLAYESELQNLYDEWIYTLQHHLQVFQYIKVLVLSPYD